MPVTGWGGSGGGGGGGGVTDHGALTGLADDDHSAYPTVAEAVARITRDYVGSPAGQDGEISLTLTYLHGQIVTSELNLAGAGSNWVQGDVFTLINGVGSGGAGVADTVGNSFEITGINQGTKTITVDGDASAIPLNDTLRIYRSTGNDNTFTVVTATFATDHTDIVVVEALPSAVADGYLGHIEAGLQGALLTYHLTDGGQNYVEDDEVLAFVDLVGASNGIIVTVVEDLPPTGGSVELVITNRGTVGDPITVPFDATAGDLADLVDASFGGIGCTSPSPNIQLGEDTLTVVVPAGGGVLPIDGTPQVDDNTTGGNIINLVAAKTSGGSDPEVIDHAVGMLAVVGLAGDQRDAYIKVGAGLDGEWLQFASND